MHNSCFACHLGISRTLSLLKCHFWWPSLEKYTRAFVSVCTVCARGKTSHRPPSGLLHLLPIPSQRWSHIALDFITGLPIYRGNTVILNTVDQFSKIIHFVAKGLSPFGSSLVYQPGFPSQDSNLAVPSIDIHLCRCHKVWRDTLSALLHSADNNRPIADRHRIPSLEYNQGQKVGLSS